MYLNIRCDAAKFLSRKHTWPATSVAGLDHYPQEKSVVDRRSDDDNDVQYLL